MNISLPEEIKINIADINFVWLKLTNNEKIVASCAVPLNHIKTFSFVTLHDELYNKCDNISYEILYKNKICQNIKFYNKEQAVYKSPINIASENCIRHRVSETFNDTEEGRTQFFNILDNKIKKAKKKSFSNTGTKNLIYYTAYFNNGYLELLNLSVESVIQYSQLNFDLMIITDDGTKKLIENLSFTKKLKPKYYITKTPKDGVEASQNKTKICEWKFINKYDKILFLDCDTVAVSSVSKIFEQELKLGTLFTAHNSNLTYNHFKTIYHGFRFLDDKFIEQMIKTSQMPFNAGQFLFRYSEQMKEHFKNVIWMMKNWSGEYFFEQCFMNYYFCKAQITDSTKLHPFVEFVQTTQSPTPPSSNKCIKHYIGPALNAKEKLKFIKKL